MITASIIKELNSPNIRNEIWQRSLTSFRRDCQKDVIHNSQEKTFLTTNERA